MKRCPKCANEIADRKRVCPFCGESQRVEARAAKKARKLVFGCCIVILVIATFLLALYIFHQFVREPSQPTPPTQSTTVPTQPQTKPTQPPTEPTTVPTEATTVPTEPPTEPIAVPTEVATQPATQATEPSTKPTEPINDELIGYLYTRRQLLAMSNTGYSYGPGITSGGKRPAYPESLQKEYGKYDANFIAPDNGNIYLTFDCGYEYIATDGNGNKYRVTERILDILKEKNVKAVFFVTLPYAKAQPDLVRRMINEGHTVGNHTKSHLIMPEQTIDTMVYEIMSVHNYIKEKFDYEMTLFRFPEGEYSTRALAVVQTLGYKTVHWSFAYLDYETDDQPSIERALNKVTSSHCSGSIYLLHAISTTNAAILSDAIDFFQAEGYNLELFQ